MDGDEPAVHGERIEVPVVVARQPGGDTGATAVTRGDEPRDDVGRKGGAADIPAIVGLFDGAMEWLVSQGRTGQW
ncbi:hypothetical protein ACWCOW_42655, partial [Streptomyces sp. NPDC001939]